MCMLSFYPDGVMPDAEHLINGCDVNPDGYGFAIITTRRELIMKRGMRSDEMVERFLNLRQEHQGGPALFHSRLATSGLVDESMCHPFQVGRDTRTVVAHNGIFFTPKGSLSDTAIFARHILPEWNIDRPADRAKLETYLRGNKIVILTAKPQHRHTAYIFGETLGHWVGEAWQSAWHSNRDYISWAPLTDEEWAGLAHYSRGDETDWVMGPSKARSYVSSDYSLKPRADREHYACELCDSRNAIDTLTRVCQVCGTCDECQMDALTKCICWKPVITSVPRAPLALPAGMGTD